jgi:hypothetical protein
MLILLLLASRSKTTYNYQTHKTDVHFNEQTSVHSAIIAGFVLYFIFVQYAKCQYIDLVIIAIYNQCP